MGQTEESGLLQGTEDAVQRNLQHTFVSSCCLSKVYTPLGLLDTILAMILWI